MAAIAPKAAGAEGSRGRTAGRQQHEHPGRACGEQYPGDVAALLRPVDPGEEGPEADRGEQLEQYGGPAGAACLGVGLRRLAPREHHADHGERHPDQLQRARPLAGRQPDEHGDHGSRGRHRRHDAHRPDRERPVERGQPQQAEHPRAGSPRRGRRVMPGGCAGRDRRGKHHEREALREHQDGQQRVPPALEAAEEVRQPHDRAEASARTAASMAARLVPG